MKMFGSWSELFSLVFRKNSQAVTLRPNQATTYTGARDMQMPPGDADHVIVSADSMQTLTNKSVDGDDNTISDLAVASLKTVIGQADKFLSFDGSGAPATAKAVPAGTVVGTSDSQALTNKTLDNTNSATFLDTSFTLQDNGDPTRQALINAANVPTGTTKTYNLPSAAGATEDLVGRTTNQTITQKSFTDTQNFIVNTSDPTKALEWDVSGVSSSSTVTVAIPDESGTMVLQTATQILTNKTLDKDLVNDYLIFNEEAAPAAAAANTVRVYAKADGQMYSKDDGGIETQLGSGSGSAESVHTVTAADYAILDGDGYSTIAVSTGGSDRTITLPDEANNASRRIRITKTDSAAGDVIIEDFANVTLYTLRSQYEAIHLQDNEGGSVWLRVGDKQASKSFVRRFGGNGLGSTATQIRRFASNFAEVVGTAITDGSSAIDGSIFTINEDGIYAITWSDDRTVGTNTQIGITKNDDAQTSGITAVTVTNILVAENYGPDSGSNGFSMSWIGPLVAGDVVRAHAESGFAGTSDFVITFTIAQVIKY